jgi:hypothetical protein
MITHVVLFEPRNPLTPDQQHGVLAGIRAVVRACPAVQACRIGRRVRHGLPGYEQAMSQDYSFALTLDFKDVEGLRAYLRHPLHEAIGGFFTSGASSSLAYDYEMQNLEEASAAPGLA